MAGSPPSKRRLGQGVSAATSLPGYRWGEGGNGLADGAVAAQGEPVPTQGSPGFKSREFFPGFHTEAGLGVGMQCVGLPPGCLQLMVALLALQIEDGTSRLFRWMLPQRAESTSAPPACLAASEPDPQVGMRGQRVAVPHGTVWELSKVERGGDGAGGGPGE